MYCSPFLALSFSLSLLLTLSPSSLSNLSARSYSPPSRAVGCVVGITDWCKCQKPQGLAHVHDTPVPTDSGALSTRLPDHCSEHRAASPGRCHCWRQEAEEDRFCRRGWLRTARRRAFPGRGDTRCQPR